MDKLTMREQINSLCEVHMFIRSDVYSEMLKAVSSCITMPSVQNEIPQILRGCTTGDRDATSEMIYGAGFDNEFA